MSCLQSARGGTTRRRSRVPAGLMLCAVWLAGSAFAQNQDHITQRAWLADPGGRLTWQQVQTQAPQAFQGVLSQGFGQGALWLKLRIDPRIRAQGVLEPERLILRIRPVYLDDIQLFDPLAPADRPGMTGDRQHPRGQAFEGLDFMLPIPRGDVPRDIWLRLESTSTRQIAVQALNYDDLRRLTHTQQLMFALYIGVILIFMVWGLVYWLFSRERVIGAFGLKQAMALVFALASLGYSRVYWPAAWPAQWLDMTTSVFSCLAVSTAVYFHVVLTREFDPPRWIVWLYRGMLGLLPIKLLLLTQDDRFIRVALNINMLEVLLAPAVFFMAVLLAKGWRRPQPRPQALLPKWVLVGFYSFLLSMLLLAALPGLGLSSGGEVPLYLVQAHGLVTAFLILLMLQYRIHIRQKQQSETALALERTRLQAAQERFVREEQDKLMAMLAHELKTPLATMQMRLDAHAPGSQEVRRAIREMNGVIERCVQTARFDDRQLQAQKSQIDLVDLIEDVVSASTQPERVQMQLPPNRVLQTDRQLLFIVLSNLLENACKYAAADTPIGLQVWSDERQVGLEMSNLPGPAGWPEADKIFEKYYRSPHARRQTGTGLGLYLVRNLTQVLGGSIEYRPDALNVRFVLRLPLQG